MGDTLLVCSGGGHLRQLHALAARIGIPDKEQHWVTFDNAQSRSLLADVDVRFVPFAGPRDVSNIYRIWRVAGRMLRTNDFERAISTGSSPAVAFLPEASRRGIRSHYIESAARADGPSLSGRIVSMDRRIHTYSQYPSWANGRWHYAGSIFDSYAPGPRRAAGPISRAVVTVGTQEGYGFRRLMKALVPLLKDVPEVLWQTGSEDVSDLGIPGRHDVPLDELSSAVADADVVVSHSGTGSAITALDAGKVPILVPRLAEFGEHVDDHQVQIASELDRRGLAFMRRPEDLTPDDLRFAAGATVERVAPPPFALEETEAADPPMRRTRHRVGEVER